MVIDAIQETPLPKVPSSETNVRPLTETIEQAENIALFGITKRRLEERISRQQARISDMKRSMSSETGGIEQLLGNTDTFAPLEYGIQFLKDELRYLRPRDMADVEYRQRVRRELPNLIKANIPPGLNLRFHGTPIYNAERIINSRGISSSVDRLGVETSNDTAGQISVTTSENCELTISANADFPGLKELQYQVPAGCIFVLLPKSHEDAASGASNLMDNVSFKQSPAQLFRVLASPEMLPELKKWLRQAGMDPSRATEYFAFADELKTMNTQLYV